MRFLTLIKSTEPAGPPPRALLDAIVKLGTDARNAGVLLDTGGLYPTAMGARVRVGDGEVRVLDGPFTETKEVVGAYAFYKVRSIEEAKEWAARFMELHKRHWPGWEGEAELRLIFEPPAPAPRMAKR